MNILLLNWQDIKHPLGGGAEVHLQEIFKRIVANGNRVTMLCSGFTGLAENETIEGIDIIRKGSRNLFNYSAPFQVRKLLSSGDFDIVVDCLNKIPLLSPLYVKNTPIMGVVHHLFKKAIFKEVFFPMALYVYTFEKSIKAVYKNIFFCVISESTKTDVMESGINEKNIEIVDICVDHKLYKTAAALKSEKPLIGYLGRIKKYKSVDHLIKAFALVKKSVPEAELVIVGDGDNLDELKALASENSTSDAVEFTGFVDEQKKVEILQSCHVVVNPSVKEGWGLTVIEANACGTPTVAANVPGLRDSVLDGKTGLLYEYGDIEACAEHIKKLLLENDFRTEITKNAIDWAAKFNWDTAAEKTLQLMQKIIDQHHKS